MICSQLGKLGRLGNQLWQFAGTLGLSFDNGDKPPFFPPWEYQPYFNTPLKYYSLELRGDESYPAATRLHPQERVYMQDYGLFQRYAAQVRQVLLPSALTMRELQQRFGEELLLEANSYTSVHVRRGDYLGVWAHHPILPESYYRQAMQMFAEPYMVFSDDIEWCQKTFSDIDDILFVGGEARGTDGPRPAPGAFSDYQDLFLMSFCRAHIIANSSYSWWGAFLSFDAQVVYPSVWYGPAATTADASLMLPPEWQRIEVEEG